MHERQQPDGANAFGEFFHRVERVVQLVDGLQFVGCVLQFSRIVFVVGRFVVEFGRVQLVVCRLEFQLEQREQQRRGRGRGRRRFVQLQLEFPQPVAPPLTAQPAGGPMP